MADLKLLYLGLDACDTPTVEGWMSEGRLPAFAAAYERGHVVPTKAPYGTFVGSTWPTFATGLRPEHHRHWNWIEVERDHTDHYASPRIQGGIPFWRRLDDAGLRVALADIPHSLAPAGFNGMFVSEWGCHDRLEGTQWTPRGLLRDLGVDPHPVGCTPAPPHSQRFAPCDNHHRTGLVRTAEETAALVDDLLVGIERKERLISRMLDDEPDALFAVFSESHCVGHQLWHVHDPTHERHDPAVLAAQPDDPLLTVYQALDAAIGRLVDRVGPDVPVALHLSHGMRAHHDGTHLLDALLWRMEDVDRGATPGRLSQTIGRLPGGLSGRALTLAYNWAGRKPESSAPADPESRSRRRFYQVHNNTVVGGIRVNLSGRETNGIVPAAGRSAGSIIGGNAASR
ncbi:MAG: alkaline phosphatase family protein, partial [Acidimicrobiales bacterium]|nr:alkaline phosphatase family protein [Acidimicrobiales bacterium]